MLRIYFFGFVFMALQFAGQSAFQALGDAKHAIFFSLLRKIIDETLDYGIFTSPVTVNGNDTNLRFAWYYDTSEIRLMDLWDGVDDNGIAARPEEALKPGDRIVPRFDAVDPDTFEESEYSGEDYIWGSNDNISFGLLPDGAYLYSFVIDDIFGGSYVTDSVSFVIDQGYITYNAA